MADIALGAFGAAVGSVFGNPMLGFSIGMTLGGLLFPPDLGTVDLNRLEEARVQGADYGDPIPIVKGIPPPFAGVVVWASDWTEYWNDVGGGKGQPRRREFYYVGSFVVQVCKGPIDSIRRIWADDEVIYDDRPEQPGYTGPKYASYLNPDHVHFRLGTDNQSPISFVEEVDGVGHTNAYRTRVLVGFEDFVVPKGRGIPNFKFEVDEAGTTRYVDGVASDLLQEVGIPASKIDLSALSAIVCHGLLVANVTECRNVLQHLERAYQFDFVELDGKVKAIKRGSLPVATIDAIHLGAKAGLEGAEQKVIITRGQEDEIPREVFVHYADKDFDFKITNQRGVRQYGSNIEPENITLPVTLSADEAATIAYIAAHVGWLQRNVYQFSLPWVYFFLGPADVVNLPVEGIGTVTVRIVEMTFNLWGEMEIVAVEEDPSIYSFQATGHTGTGDSSVSALLATDFAAMDSNALRDADADSIGFYTAASGGGDPWPGASIEKPTGGFLHEDGTISLVGTSNEYAAKHGTAETELADCLKPEVWDTVNTVDVHCRKGALLSSTDEAVLNGANTIVIGQEIIQYVTATSLGDGVYRLSRLLRGRRGTEYAMNQHVVGEKWFLADTVTVRRANLNWLHKGTTFTLKAYEYRKIYSGSVVPAEQNLGLTGNSRMPYSPVHIKGERDVDDDLTISWIRRARKNHEWLSYGDVPLDESSERYEVDIMDGVTVVRTLEVSGGTSVVYSAADQATDFGSAQAEVTVKVYQIGDVIGRGRPGTATI